MLRSLNTIRGYDIAASDGEIGDVHDFYVDEAFWVIRYLVVDTGRWLPGRKVLIDPEALGEPVWLQRRLPIELSREQVQNAPDMATDLPLSKREELALRDHYKWRYYWDFSAMGIAPPNLRGAMAPLASAERDPERKPGMADPGSETSLRSAREVTGYEVAALDGEIGRIDDFVIDDANWTIRYLIAETGRWLSSRKVLLDPGWTSAIDWLNERLTVELDRETVRRAPPFDPAEPINRAYEEQFYDYYGRPAYFREIAR